MKKMIPGAEIVYRGHVGSSPSMSMLSLPMQTGGALLVRHCTADVQLGPTCTGWSIVNC